jgi:membrane protein
MLSGVLKHFNSSQSSTAWQSENLVTSFLVVTLLFALMFKYLPDADVHWSDVWQGAIAIGLLFTVGKFLLGWYLARGSTTSVYGAAGSLVAVLLWVYYSAQILFFGAELTESHARLCRGTVKASENAVKTANSP